MGFSTLKHCPRSAHGPRSATGFGGCHFNVNLSKDYLSSLHTDYGTTETRVPRMESQILRLDRTDNHMLIVMTVSYLISCFINSRNVLLVLSMKVVKKQLPICNVQPNLNIIKYKKSLVDSISSLSLFISTSICHNSQRKSKGIHFGLFGFFSYKIRKYKADLDAASHTYYFYAPYCKLKYFVFGPTLAQTPDKNMKLL